MSMGGLAPSTQLDARSPDFRTKARAAREAIPPVVETAPATVANPNGMRNRSETSYAVGRGERRSRSSGILAVGTPGGGVLVADMQQHIDPPVGTGLDAVDRARERRRSERHYKRRQSSSKDCKDGYTARHGRHTSRHSLADDRISGRDQGDEELGNGDRHTACRYYVDTCCHTQDHATERCCNGDCCGGTNGSRYHQEGNYHHRGQNHHAGELHHGERRGSSYKHSQEPSYLPRNERHSNADTCHCQDHHPSETKHSSKRYNSRSSHHGLKLIAPKTVFQMDGAQELEEALNSMSMHDGLDTLASETISLIDAGKTYTSESHGLAAPMHDAGSDNKRHSGKPELTVHAVVDVF